MKHFILTALFAGQLLLENTAVFAQTSKVDGTNIVFNLPNTKWVLKASDKSADRSFQAYLRVPITGDDSKPSIAFIVETLSEHINLNDYLHEKIRLAKITPVRFGSEKFGLINGRLCKGTLGKDTVYLGCAVNGLKATMIICEVLGTSFANYDEEFKSLLASLNYVYAPDNKTAPSKPTTALPEKNSGSSCSYFPVVNGMKFTYLRNDMTGEHTIAESYTAVKDKTLKSGKVIKGYKINTTVANRNNTIIYYYCEDGSVKMYSEMPAYNTYIKEYVEDYSILPSDYNKPDYKKTPVWETEKTGSGKYLSFTELKNGGEGTEWTDRQVVNSNPVTISSEVVETGLSLTVRGKNYSPVIHVERTVTIEYLGEEMELNTQDIYYAKGVGKIKVVEKGKDLLMGNSFTTTQELVSYNIPVK